MLLLCSIEGEALLCRKCASTPRSNDRSFALYIALEMLLISCYVPHNVSPAIETSGPHRGTLMKKADCSGHGNTQQTVLELHSHSNKSNNNTRNDVSVDDAGNKCGHLVAMTVADEWRH